MELIRNLHWMCRVCSINIRKRRSTTTAMQIFDSPQILEKLRKYLHMDIEYGDKLPKHICASCFKRLEGVCNFANLAKKTENFLKDFINIAENNLKNRTTTSINNRFQNEFASFALLSGVPNEQDLNISTEEIESTQNDIKTELQNNSILVGPFSSVQEALMVSTNADADTLKEKIVVAAKPTHTRRNSKTVSSSKSVKPVPIAPKPPPMPPTQPPQIIQLVDPHYSASNDPDVRNNLDQKRKNLKMILAHNSINQIPAAQKPNVVALQQPLTPVQIEEMPGNTSNELVYDCLNLGCVIKDMDLLKLILKALKWPFTRDTLNSQIQRLKNTRFRDVMIDPNLLQDTDLMQILSSYLSPILLHSQNVAVNTNSSANASVCNILPALQTYKIPADTSVHLVSVPLESPEKNMNRKQVVRKRRGRKPMKPRVIENSSPIEILSDDDTRDVQTFEVNVDPALYFPVDSESQENSSESIVMSLEGVNNNLSTKHILKARRKHRRKEAHMRLHSEKYVEQEIINLDDMESEHSFIDTEHMKSESIKQEGGIVVDAESLGSQFPLVATIEENSNHEVCWDEFKPVVDDERFNDICRVSLDTEEIEEINISRPRDPSPHNNEVENNIKREEDVSFFDKEIKVEPEEVTETSVPYEKQQQETASEEMEIADPCNLEIKGESDIEIKTEKIDVEETNIGGLSVDQNVQNFQQIHIRQQFDDEIISSGSGLPEKRGRGRPPKCGLKALPKIKESTVVKTRSSMRVQSLTNTKRIPRIPTRFAYSLTVKKKDSKFQKNAKR